MDWLSKSFFDSLTAAPGEGRGLLSLSKKPRRVPPNGRNQVKSILGADRIRAKNSSIRASVRPQGVRAARMQIR